MLKNFQQLKLLNEDANQREYAENKYSSFISLPEMNTLGMITLRLKNFFNNVRTKIHFPLYNVKKALRFSSRRRRGGKGGEENKKVGTVGREKKEKKENG